MNMSELTLDQLLTAARSGQITNWRDHGNGQYGGQLEDILVVVSPGRSWIQARGRGHGPSLLLHKRGKQRLIDTRRPSSNAGAVLEVYDVARRALERTEKQAGSGFDGL